MPRAHGLLASDDIAKTPERILKVLTECNEGIEIDLTLPNGGAGELDLEPPGFPCGSRDGSTSFRSLVRRDLRIA
jgi:hypothetical protein